ncbi:cytochrome P450 [Pseudonocardia sp.]|uniref:cytochrome P450 n=1 Tax=Pseudonocardia sp. TaxID=60912 RepID=UPI0031FC182E
MPNWVARARAAGETSLVFAPDFDARCLTRYAENKRVALDGTTFSSRNNNELIPMSSEVLRKAFPDGHPGAHSMLKKDGGDHDRLRRAADFAFNRKAVAEFEPTIEQLVNELLDDIVHDDRFDFVAQFAVKLPVRTVLSLAGIPRGQESDFMAWGHDSFSLIKGSPALSVNVEQELADRAVRVRTWMLDFVAARRADPQNDLVSRLIEASDADGRKVLSDDEVIGVVNSLLTAGIVTTSTFLPLLVRSVLSDPELWQRVKSDPVSRDRAVEEALRFWTPARAARRLVTRDVEIDGLDLREGESVYLLWAGANHDPEVFANPGMFDIDREGLTKHLSFGRGIHVCLGASLARAQSRMTLRLLGNRMPDLCIADPTTEDASYTRRHNPTPVPTLNSLMLRPTGPAATLP